MIMLKKFNFNIAYAILLMLFCILLSTSIVSAGQVMGNTFADIQNEVDNPLNGGTVDLTGGTTYSNNGNGRVLVHNKNIVIQGINGKATLDANLNNYIFAVNSTSTVTFRNISFINGNSSTNPGGAILAHTTVIIEDCTFENNYGQSGAAIMVGDDATGSIIRNCNFTNNHGIYESPIWGWGEGSAIDSHANNTLIENCSFENNYAKNNGGAISFAIGTNNTVINCTFFNNSADNSGGAILLRNSTAKVINCTFIGNNASYGSAIFNDINSELNITNCTFNNNFAGTNIITPSNTIIYRPNNALTQVSLVSGDNIAHAIYNTGNITINNSIPIQSVSIPNQELKLTINGITYTSYTNINGVTTFSIPTSNLGITTYTYNIVYQQTTLYKGSTRLFMLTVTETTSSGTTTPPGSSGTNTGNTNTGSSSSGSGSTNNISTGNTGSTSNNSSGNSNNNINIPIHEDTSGSSSNIKSTIPGQDLYTSYNVPKTQNLVSWSNLKLKSKDKKTATYAIVIPKIKIKVPSVTTLRTVTHGNGYYTYNPLETYNVTGTRYITVNGAPTYVKITDKNKDKYKLHSKVKGKAKHYTGTKTTTKYLYGDNPSTKTKKNQDYMKVTGKKTKDYTKYIQPSEFCESDNPKIKKQSNAITKKIKGAKTDIKKANAILNWVQKNVKYELYGGTHKGALGLLESGKSKSGKSKQMTANCADQAHLTVALLRSQNIPAQYRSNGYYDKNGKFSGHAWVYVGTQNKKGKVTWQSGQPTNEKGSNFGSKNDEWAKKPLLKNYGHNTENYNIQVTSKKVNKDVSIRVESQTVTVNGKTKQTLFTQHSDKKKKK
jgi:predicted outer membrane repeat protein